jgi:hypothetical protein
MGCCETQDVIQANIKQQVTIYQSTGRNIQEDHYENLKSHLICFVLHSLTLSYNKKRWLS